jgi:GDP-L-fucose synthase
VAGLDGRRVAVTGGTGFLGRHVVAELESRGATVSALGRSDYDLVQRSEIDRLLDELQPDAVVHLAAVVGGIGANRAEPGRFFYENALMGIELLEACRVRRVSKVVVAGTVCAYPKVTPVPFEEDSLWSGYPEETNAPYGLAKKMLLVQAQAYRRQYGMNAIYLLPVNLYGPGDNFDLETGHVIPAMVRRFAEARDAGHPSVTLWGDGSPTREFLYVGDAARAFALALERYDGEEPVNLGSGDEISIRELSALIADLSGYSGAVEWDATKPNGQPRRCLATSRAREMFGFEAAVPLREGLAATIEWYEANRAPLSG